MISLPIDDRYVTVGDEVAAAMANGRPVVALESTILAHGFPFPRNLELGRDLEQRVRDRGAVPATIAVLDGRARIGLSSNQLERIARPGNVVKASRRDLPFVIATRGDAATTVASTMLLAARAGIRVFATGGIGGVHRGWQQSMDVSADLEELGRTDVVVVCAGAKSILDIGLTLEVLETKGVPVIGFRTSKFPAFYCRDSGYPVDHRVDSVAELVEIVRVKAAVLGLGGGVIVANPIEPESELDPEQVDALIGRALEEAANAKIVGKEVTPFVLGRIERLSGGESVEANRKLVLSNAALAAELACGICGLPEAATRQGEDG